LNILSNFKRCSIVDLFPAVGMGWEDCFISKGEESNRIFWVKSRISNRSGCQKRFLVISIQITIIFRVQFGNFGQASRQFSLKIPLALVTYFII